MAPFSKDERQHQQRLALLRAYQRDIRDYVLYARRAKTERARNYWLKAAATCQREIERLQKELG